MKQYRLGLAIVLVLTALVGGCTRRVPGAGPRVSADSTEAIRLNNRGVAEMNRGRTAQALDLFREAWRRDAGLFAARLNEGIALLNAQRFEEAREVLLDATRRQPDSARAWFNLGILYRNLAQPDAAIQAFERVTRIDPGDADAFYFMGQLHAQQSQFAEAIRWYELCLALDSFHLSAEFGLARAYQLSGNDEAARRHLSRFDQLTQSRLGKPISLVYGEQGPYSTAEPVAGATAAPCLSIVKFIFNCLNDTMVDARKAGKDNQNVLRNCMVERTESHKHAGARTLLLLLLIELRKNRARFQARARLRR